MTYADDLYDDYGEPDPGDYDDDDRYDEFKDDLAMGYINPDGSQREPDPPDYDPWDWHPSLRDRTARFFRGLRYRATSVLRPHRYDDEPPF